MKIISLIVFIIFISYCNCAGNTWTVILEKITELNCGSCCDDDCSSGDDNGEDNDEGDEDDDDHSAAWCEGDGSDGGWW